MATTASLARADCLAGFVDRLGLEKPHVAGLSFGGALALELLGYGDSDVRAPVTVAEDLRAAIFGRWPPVGPVP